MYHKLFEKISTTQYHKEKNFISRSWFEIGREIDWVASTFTKGFKFEKLGPILVEYGKALEYKAKGAYMLDGGYKENHPEVVNFRILERAHEFKAMELEKELYNEWINS